ncbi:MAG: imidazole glycerol phosphate synthase subunit HisH [SAR324 cluster bacterium]|uniref:Imidazole glycerol phosphate synthase subunit HisH n=1 Tax=SAR324 cluster bacterium TaxID=2024889 RepID=A0A7X9FQD8_9DELT|nr:imidazole glycerol phosphate synthase subunit HisH [SAR324 cluster bacterium]
MVSPELVIVDYGVGNLFNVQKVFEECGSRVTVSDDCHTIRQAARLLLPGVGAFGEAMEQLRRRGLIDAVKDFVSSGRPLMAICVGAQVLLSSSEEFGFHAGLDLIPGEVKRFSALCGKKIPEIGWNSLIPSENRVWEGTCLSGLGDSPYVYFNHSFVMIPNDSKHSLADSDYGTQRFCAAVAKDNMVGLQFHLELSGPIGVKIAKNFLSR